MNKYTKPEITIVNFEAVNVIATSGTGSRSLTTWGSNIKSVDASEIDLFD